MTQSPFAHSREPEWLQEYYAIKAKYCRPGQLLFFQMGDFYEVFDADAATVAEALGSETRKREIGPKTRGSAARSLLMLGIPLQNLEQTVETLNKKGLEVVVIERNERGEILSTRQYSAIETEAVAAEAADEAAESDPQAEERAQVAAAYQIEIDRLTREKDRLQDTLDEIQEANDELTAQRDALRAALDDARRGERKPAPDAQPVEIRTITAVWGRGEPEKLARSDADLAAALADGWQIINFMSAIDNGGLYNRVVTLLRRGGEAARHPEAEGAPPAPQPTPVELPDDVAGESGDASEGTQKAA